MTTATIQKLKNEIKKELLEEFILPMLENSKDPEGEYREDFIKEIFRISKSIDNGKGKKFSNAKALKLYLEKI